MSCAEVLEHDQPLEAFSAGLLNFYNHYFKDLHDSVWCQFHLRINDDGSLYTTKSPLFCSVQFKAFEELLKSMGDKPQEYITTTGKVTTNSIEGFHGLALEYRGSGLTWDTPIIALRPTWRCVTRTWVPSGKSSAFARWG